MRIWILDDLHGKEIYNDLKEIFPKYTYPIKKDIKDPLPYIKKIKNGDIILLDNYFDGREAPLGDPFLKEYLKIGMNCKIIAISDFGEKLTEMFDNRKKTNDKGDIIGRIKTKKGKDIAKFIKEYFQIN